MRQRRPGERSPWRSGYDPRIVARRMRAESASWWVGLTREQFMAELRERQGKADPQRPVYPTLEDL